MRVKCETFSLNYRKRKVYRYQGIKISRYFNIGIRKRE